MKKSIKKIASIVTAAALALGMAMVPTVNAKAADGDWVLIGNQSVLGEWNSANAVALTDNSDGTFSTTIDVEGGKCYEFKAVNVANGAAIFWENPSVGGANGNASFFAKSASTTTITLDVQNSILSWDNTTTNIDPNPAEKYYVVGSMNGWNISDETTEMTKKSDGTYEITFEGIPGDTYEFKVVQDAPTYGWYKAWGSGEGNAVNDEGLEWDGENLTITFDPETKAITSSAEEAELEGGDDGEEEIDPEADCVVFHVATEWVKPKAYLFGDAHDATELFGGWPGKAMTSNDANPGYYSISLALDDITDSYTVIINSAAGQTVNIPVPTLKEGKNEFWIEILDELGEEDEYGNANHLANITSESPEGWVNSEIQPSDPEDPADDPEDDPEDDDDTDEGENGWDSMKLKLHFLNSENWEKVGVFCNGKADWSNVIAGDWPGVEMTLESSDTTESGVSEEGWYAWGTNKGANDVYNIIFNNLVSDEMVENEGAVKHQTRDITNFGLNEAGDDFIYVTAGEYWFVLGDVLSEDETMVKYDIKWYTSVEDLEADGYVYDGNGIQIDADEDDDDDTEDPADDDTEDDVDPTETGDMVPYAVLLVGVAAVVAVVASKKRHHA